MGHKDLQLLLFLLAWLLLGHAFEVLAQTVEEPPPPPPPPNSTWAHWNVTGNPGSLDNPITTILRSPNGNFSFNLLLTNQSRSSSCAAAVQHTSSDTAVWVATFNASSPSGQENPSNQNVTCFLHFARGVGLVLNNSDDQEIWSTRGLKLSRKGYFDFLQLDDAGGLYMKNMTNLRNSVWASFDYPGDTLVRGQYLVAATTMSAAQLDQRYSTGGAFYMRIDGASVRLFQDFKVNGTSRYMSYWKSSNPDPQNNAQAVSSVTIGDGGLVGVNRNGSFLLAAAEGGNWDYARLGFDGGLVLRSYNGSRASQGEAQLVIGGVCARPAECGSYGICGSDGICKCPDGFAQANVAAGFTCQRNGALNTTDCSRDKIVNITGQPYLDVWNVSTAADVTATACESRCKEDCNCTNALHVRRFANSSSGACYVNLDSMQTIRQAVGDGPGVQMLFLRIPGAGNFALPAPSTRSSRRTAALAFAGGAGALVLWLLAMSAWWLVHQRRKLFGAADSCDPGVPPSQLPPQFSYKQLDESTSSFSQKLGCSGVSSVYAGSLPPDNTKVAVKNLDENGHKDKEFLAAVATMSSLSHANLVPLVGFCKEGQHKMLVYELVNEGRSLNWFLFQPGDSGPLIDAQTRRSIALGTAQGLAHLHEDYDTGGVAHGGVKPENIMIDTEMRPRVVDYGLVHLTPRFQRLNSAKSRGSRAYMAPEWVKLAPITEKVDVYSLGVVILELVSGRRCWIPDASPPEKRFLPTWAFSMLRHGNHDPDSVLELVDSRLGVEALPEVDQQVLKGMTLVALWCVQEDPALRPPMTAVVQMLDGDLEVHTPPLSPAGDASARDLCEASESTRFMHSPSLSEDSDMRPSPSYNPRLEAETSRHDHIWLLQT